MNYQIIYKDTYLAHHGILGQKWGKRNGPPYPLSSNQMSSSETKHKYSRKNAKAMARERDAIEEEKYKKITGRNQKMVDALQRTANRGIQKTYRYDSDNNQVFSQDTMSLEALAALEKINQLDEKAKQDAEKYANDLITKKYGDYAVKDIDKYETQNALIFLSVMAPLMVLPAALTFKKGF